MSYVRIDAPEWCRDSALYQINTRQFTPEGTFRAAQRELPRLRALGVSILWIMPIHPIGEINRKGSLGSPYAVKDYYGVNPEFGDFEGFRAFVAAAHAEGLRVILDWVGNHTAWDNPLVEAHPEWYARDWKGRFRPTPWWDWDDVIDLDYRHPELRRYMSEAMQFWVREADVDGFRCDVAGYIPVEFWNQVRRELDAIKPVFMLAEWESRDLHAEAFDLTYAWSWYDAVHRVVNGQADVSAIIVFYAYHQGGFPEGGMRMTFVSNHDEDAWKGTAIERFGAGLEVAITLSVIGEGMPLIYNGQEAAHPKPLPFFERDPIAWRPHPVGDLYRELLAVKKAHSALWNGKWGAPMMRVPNSDESRVLSFVRRDERSKVFAVFNFSATAAAVTFRDDLFVGNYREPLKGEERAFAPDSVLELAPWSFAVYCEG